MEGLLPNRYFMMPTFSLNLTSLMMKMSILKYAVPYEILSPPTCGGIPGVAGIPIHNMVILCTFHDLANEAKSIRFIVHVLGRAGTGCT